MQKNKVKIYLEQWERTIRWFNRIQKIKNSPPREYAMVDCLDMIYAFFLNCFHLKDWIKASRPDLENKAEDLFDKDKGKQCFKICADLANSLKHMEVTKNPRLNNEVFVKQISSTTIKLPLSYCVKNKDGKIEPPYVKNAKKSKRLSDYQGYIEISDTNYDVYSLSEDCMKEWKIFLENNSLL